MTLNSEVNCLRKDGQIVETDNTATVAPALDSICVSTVPNIKTTTTTDKTVTSILQEIKGGHWAKYIDPIRKAFQGGGKAAADPIKKKLPAILFSGSFSKRSAKHLVQPSGLLCIDVDGLNGGLNQVRKKIENDPHTLACFLSPSGNGLKVLIRIPPSEQLHTQLFQAVFNYFNNCHKITPDNRCGNIVHPCFVSYDPSLFLNPQAKLFALPAKCYIANTANIANISHRGLGRGGEWGSEKACEGANPVQDYKKVEEIISNTQPRRQGERNAKVFDLARGLRLDAGLQGMPKPQLKEIVRKWHKQALTVIATRPFSETWADFLHAWPNVHTALCDSPLQKAWERVVKEPLPEICNNYDGERVKKLLALCFYLKRKDRSFYLSTHKAASFLKCKSMQVLRYLRMFIFDEVLIRLEKGEKGQASTYKWC